MTKAPRLRPRKGISLVRRKTPLGEFLHVTAAFSEILTIETRFAVMRWLSSPFTRFAGTSLPGRKYCCVHEGCTQMHSSVRRQTPASEAGVKARFNCPENRRTWRKQAARACLVDERTALGFCSSRFASPESHSQQQPQRLPMHHGHHFKRHGGTGGG